MTLTTKILRSENGFGYSVWAGPNALGFVWRYDAPTRYGYRRTGLPWRAIPEGVDGAAHQCHTRADAIQWLGRSYDARMRKLAIATDAPPLLVTRG